MSKDKDVTKILRFAKGKEFKTEYNRFYVLKDGVKTLTSESVNETDHEPFDITFELNTNGKQTFASKESDVEL